jgi:very-short-patch-repair endonuclease
MEKLVCKICGKEFEYEKLRYCRAQLHNHLKMEHNITLEDYLVKYELGGNHPKCLCGCGENVTLDKNWKWHKYAKDSHVGRAFTESAKRIKEEMIASRRIVFNPKEYYQNKYDMELARSSATDFLSRKYTLSELSEKYKLDKRTLKKMWIELDLVSGEDYAKITSYLKYKLSQNTRFENNLEDDNCYRYIYNLLKSNPQKYNIRSAIREYNAKDEYKINTDPWVFYCQMKKMYGNEIDLYSNKGYHSKEEYDFLNVLQFYFSEHKINLGYKITKEIYDYIYDFCIDDKLLIEYDSKGQYHLDEKQKNIDEKKEKYAKENGFKFIRLDYETARNINTLKDIEICLNS